MNTASALMDSPGIPEDGSDERELARRARDGNLAAFEQLYRRHVGRVHAVCLRIAGNRTLAEECTQDAFVQAWQALGTFRGDSAFGSWLHRIAVNTVLERHRTRLRQSAWFERQDETTIEAVAAPEDRSETALDLERAIAGLPDAARAVFVLHDVEGYQHHEIAHMTGLAVGTCKAHLHRAHQLLKTRLES